MTYSVYIDHPDSIDSYEFLPGEKYGEDVVSRKIGVRVNFVCNSLAKMSKGDIYEVPFDNPEDVTAFVLKYDFELIDKDNIEKYRNRKR
jgi:hypothetical protein